MHKMISASKNKVRQYSDEYLKFGFLPAPHSERSPFCLSLQHSLISVSIREGRLEAHSKAKHGVYMNYDLNRLKSVNKKFEKVSTIDSLFSVRIATKILFLKLVMKCFCPMLNEEKSYYLGGFNQF
jgi:hypothetical protein